MGENDGEICQQQLKLSSLIRIRVYHTSGCESAAGPLTTVVTDVVHRPVISQIISVTAALIISIFLVIAFALEFNKTVKVTNPEQNYNILRGKYQSRASCRKCLCFNEINVLSRRSYTRLTSTLCPENYH